MRVTVSRIVIKDIGEMGQWPWCMRNTCRLYRVRCLETNPFKSQLRVVFLRYDYV